MAATETRPPAVKDDWDYLPSAQTSEMVAIADKYGLFIDGRFRAPRSRKYLDTINPATEEPLARVAEAGPADVDLAVTAARQAFEGDWGRMGGAERAKFLFRIARMLQERSREFAVLETIDGGKPIKEARDVDLPLAAAHFFYYAGWADKLEYAFPGVAPEPLGVAGQVIPWNFPMMMLAWKVAPALATGNTVVLKPAETTPLTALLFAELAAEAGLPPGVLNIVTGAGRTGAALVEHPGLDKVAFTGSTAVGKGIQRALAGSGRKLTLELGGKGAHVIFDDAPVDQAVEGVINGIFFNQGHVCCAGSPPVRPGEHLRPLPRQAAKPAGDPPGRRPARQEHRHRGDQQRRAAAAHRGAGHRRGRRGRRPLSTRLRAARPRLLLQAHPVHRGVAEPSDRPGGDLRAGAVGDELPHPGGGGREGQQHPLRALGRECGPRRAHASCGWPTGCGPGWSGPTPTTSSIPTSPFGGYRESGFGREGGRHGLAGYLRGPWS